MQEPQTPVLRFDVTTDAWVLFAPERAHRPHERSAPPCPFCPGNEALTPYEVLRERDPSSAGWSLRVVLNKYPILDTDATSQPEHDTLFRETPGYGVHEVLVESPDHARALADQPVEHVERVLRTLRDRTLHLLHDARLRAVVAFKNQGERAGTSLSHPHWQLVATPVVPRFLRLEREAARSYFESSGRNPYTEIIERERKARVRLLGENDAYVALLPFASSVPYQVRLLPRTAVASFAAVADGDLQPLAELFQQVLLRIRAALADPDLNVTVTSAASGDEAEPSLVWHLDVLPRLNTPAGFELGSGMAINTVLPERAAALLRSVLL